MFITRFGSFRTFFANLSLDNASSILFRSYRTSSVRKHCISKTEARLNAVGGESFYSMCIEDLRVHFLDNARTLLSWGIRGITLYFMRSLLSPVHLEQLFAMQPSYAILSFPKNCERSMLIPKTASFSLSSPRQVPDSSSFGVKETVTLNLQKSTWQSPLVPRQKLVPFWTGPT